MGTVPTDLGQFSELATTSVPSATFRTTSSDSSPAESTEISRPANLPVDAEERGVLQLEEGFHVHTPEVNRRTRDVSAPASLWTRMIPSESVGA